MKLQIALVCASFAALALPAAAQLPAPGEPAKPTGAPAAAPVASLSSEAMNADLKTAREANQNKHYADAESLMLKDTAAKPNQPYLWIELGNAQLGLKKYTDAETSFNAALSNGESTQKQTPSGGFYSADGKGGTNAHASIASNAAAPDKKNEAEIQGISDSALGEIYIRTNRTPDGQRAFDQAAAANPAQAAFYLRNEAILLLQTGHAAEQVAAADKAIALDPKRADLYFFKGQGLAAQATIDPKTQKLVLPAGCADALQKYLDLDPTGQYANDDKSLLAAAGVPVKPGKK